ncbi:PREDICTED: uncharacterized protein LOC108571381 [Habropoda laboriosa]|uniref:uncharacterized protein LOC108571381 n=1 Tax=Habropoda laboriosa TaxID=597456 RepID=UPI00083E59DA|nr:PREDICTED: uncharacterized protein LOC108571381 [Habropoda laboriosa]
MFVKLILVATMFSLVRARTVEAREVQHLSLFGDPRPDSIVDTESTVTKERRAPLITTNAPTVDVPDPSHESTHPASKHPNKRENNNRDDRQTDLRPGCCG